MDSRIIFLDIDGTLRDFDGYIPPSAVDAIHAAQRNGHKVCISSGRPYCHLDSEIMDIGFDGVVAGAGSYVVYEGKCTAHMFFPPETGRALCEWLAAHGCVMELHTYRSGYVLADQAEAFFSIRARIREIMGKDPHASSNDPQAVNSVDEVGQLEKLLFFSSVTSEEEVQKAWGKDIYLLPLSIPNCEKWGGEISPASVNKSVGLRSLLDAAGYEAKDAVAVGDSENDIEMMRFAGVGVAMGNGRESAKEAADLVTAPLREDGLWKAFKTLGLI